MYLPRRFAETDLAELDLLVSRDAFVTLITTADGLPFASHLPVLYRRDGETVRFSGHWAKPNPQARHEGPALLIVHGPHAYISPSWYPSPADHVPTWNYAVAHISGSLERFDDSDRLASLVSDLAQRYEQPLESGWQPARGSPDFAQDMRAIVGFDLVAERIELKFKLNQNHPAGNIVGAVTGLEQQSDHNAVEIAALMRDRLTRRHT